MQTQAPEAESPGVQIGGGGERSAEPDGTGPEEGAVGGFRDAGDGVTVRSLQPAEVVVGLTRPAGRSR